jgi:tetratricopeptide (TPR) repeat protein
MGEYQKALIDFEKAMSIDSNVAESYNRRGVLFANSGDIDKALDDFSKAVKLNAKHAGAYTNRASIYLKKRDLQKAISDCTKAIELAPYAFEPYYNRGLAYMNINEPEKALEDYNKAIELSPKNAEAYAKRGLILSALGDVREAISDYEKFLELDPNNEKVTLVRDAINDLKKSKIPGDTDGDAQERKENAEAFKEEARKGLKFLIIGGIAGIIIMAIIVAISEMTTAFTSTQEIIMKAAAAVVWGFGIGSSITSFATVWSMIWKASNSISNYFIRICRFFTGNINKEFEDSSGCVIFCFTLVFVVPWLFFGTALICPIITIVRLFKLKKQIKQADEDIEFCKRFL